MDKTTPADVSHGVLGACRRAARVQLARNMWRGRQLLLLLLCCLRDSCERGQLRAAFPNGVQEKVAGRERAEKIAYRALVLVPLALTLGAHSAASIKSHKSPLVPIE